MVELSLEANGEKGAEEHDSVAAANVARCLFHKDSETNKVVNVKLLFIFLVLVKTEMYQLIKR